MEGPIPGTWEAMKWHRHPTQALGSTQTAWHHCSGLCQWLLLHAPPQSLSQVQESQCPMKEGWYQLILLAFGGSIPQAHALKAPDIPVDQNPHWPPCY